MPTDLDPSSQLNRSQAGQDVADGFALLAQSVQELRDTAVVLLNNQGCFVTWNQGVAFLLGYERLDWLGSPFHRIFTDNDGADGIPEQELLAAGSQGFTSGSRWYRRKDGELTFLEGNLQVLRSGTGERIGFSYLLRDAGTWQRTEDCLQTTLDSIGDAFYAIDSDFRFSYVNKKAEEWWGRSRQKLLGRHYWTEFPQAVGCQLYNMHLQVMANRVPVHFETLVAIYVVSQVHVI